jgi:Icc-related predicted phosphoesterase
MRLWVVSDLHLDFTRGWDLLPPTERPDFDVLVVAGDLMPGMDRGTRWILDRVRDRPVVYVPGNHEAYGTDIDRTVDAARDISSGTNVYALQNETIVVGGIKFICATLWTDFALFGNPRYAMDLAATRNDCRMIRTGNSSLAICPADLLARHRVSRLFIETELGKPYRGKTVVVTHHGPYRQAIPRSLENQASSACHCSDLTSIIATFEPNVWIYGHTHKSDHTLLGRTRLVSNPKGYGPWLPYRTCDNGDFDPGLTIEV